MNYDGVPEIARNHGMHLVDYTISPPEHGRVANFFQDPETVDFGFGLLSASSVNELLMAVYDALEGMNCLHPFTFTTLSNTSLVHRTLARKDGVVNRDLSIFNIMMLSTLECHTDRRNYLQDFPRPIDESLMRKARLVLNYY